jgi:hypothetical protein
MMSKKTFMATIIITAFLISLVAGMQTVKVAKANPIPWFANPQMTVTIQSPVSGATCALPLLVSFTAQGDWQFSVSDNATQDYPRSFFYVLDGQDKAHSGLRFAGTKTTQIYGDPVYKYNFSGQASLTDITDGIHSITVYFGAVNKIGLVGTPSESIVYNPSWQATSQFYVDSTITPTPTLAPAASTSPTPTSTPTLNVSLSESASALNFGNRVNFTVTVEGGKAPYTYTWNVEESLGSRIIETTASPYYSSDAFGIGSHHVYVQVADAENNSATTLTVAFEVLPSPSAAASPSPSPTLTVSPIVTLLESPTLQPTLLTNQTPNKTQDNFTPTLIIAVLVVVAVVVVALLVYFAKHKGKK